MLTGEQLAAVRYNFDRQLSSFAYERCAVPNPFLLSMLPDLQLHDLLRLRKPHPCGSYEWTVVRLGADIGLECKGCGHRVLLTRRELAKRMKANLTRRDEQQRQA